MEKLAQEKLESLVKYVPFIDFVLEIDKEKYIKFINIRKWIILKKKKYPLSDLNKIEQSIITQYKNLLVENNVQIPENITKIFAPMNFKQFVNLCSDDEEEDTEQITKKQDNTSTTKKSKLSKDETNERNKCSKSAKEVDDSDDDLEIVSIDYVKLDKEVPKNKNSTSSNVVLKQDVEFDDVSKDILNKIDKLTEDDIKLEKSSVYEPINYTYQEKDCCDITKDNREPDVEEEVIYQRRSNELFKRRADFKTEVQEDAEINLEPATDTFNLNDVVRGYDEVEVENIESKNKTNRFTNNPIEIISLDSCSDDEDNQPSTSKAAALKTRLSKKSDKLDSASKETEKISEEENSNCTNKKVDLLCNSIDSAFMNVSGLMEELNESKEANTNSVICTKPGEKQMSETSNDKEIFLQSPQTNKTNSLSQEQLCQLLADISNKKDFDMDAFYTALSCVKQMSSPSPSTKSTENNSPSLTITETPPPAPPPIKNLTTPPIQPLQQPQTPFFYNVNQPTTNICYPPQQPQHLNPPLTPHYPQNANFAPAPSVAPVAPRPKVNINDPRIVKQLQTIQNSPLFTYNVLNPEIANSIMQICQSQKFQSQQQTIIQSNSTYSHNNCTISGKTNTPSSQTNSLRKSTDTAPTTSSSITYGEYKRRQQEHTLQMEKKREEERKIRAEKELEKKKKDEEIRSKLLSTLTPCTEQLTTMWSKQKNLNNNTSAVNNSKNIEIENLKENKQNKTTSSSSVESNTENKEKKTKQNAHKQTKDRKEKDTTQSKSNGDPKLNRIYKELRCTVKGFDQLNDYITNIDENTVTNDNSTTDSNSSTSTEVAFTPRPIGLRRRSSIHALSAITEQLGQQSSDCSDSDASQKRVKRTSSNYEPKRRSEDSHCITSSKNVSQDTVQTSPKRRKTIDEIIKPNKRTKALRIVDDDSATSYCTSDDETNCKNSKENFNLNQPVIKLRRISQEFIRKHIKRRKEEIEPSSRLRKNCEKVVNTVETAQKLNKLKKYNNDCQMTERNTFFCVLCRSKPSDLTNHYIGRHKTESYVARLDWSELDDLSINTPFAKLQPRTKNARFDRYEVDCPFCKDKIVDQFNNLYQHYSAHTGEYAFQCSHCNLTKPYRPDIQSHILHSKTCRNAITQILYRYPPSAQCIYLHFCTICNFVQLNEANVLKHLREHHDNSKAIASNVQKYILAAISDGPDVNEANKPPTPPLQRGSIEESSEQINGKSNSINTTCKQKHINTVQLPGEVLQAASTSNGLNFKVDDDDIPVSNEPCCEEEFSEENKYSLEEQLKQLHEGPTTHPNVSTQVPMTAIPNVNTQIPMTAIPNVNTQIPMTAIPNVSTQIPMTAIPNVNTQIPMTAIPNVNTQIPMTAIPNVNTQIPMTAIPNVNTQIPMTVIHCMGEQLKQSSDNAIASPATNTARPQPEPPSDRHLPMIIKTELNMDVEEHRLLTPPKPTSNKAKEYIPAVLPTQSSTNYEKYRSYPQNVNYLGLYKCMIDDCYYSTDYSEEFCKHLTDHSSDHEPNLTDSYLQCPYCVITTAIPMNPMQLVEHVRSQHERLIYQCSMCCYRSCDASNVYIHQSLHHNTQLKSCKIYKCTSREDSQVNSRLHCDLNEQIFKNVFKSYCNICKTGYYHTQLLIHHIYSVHNIKVDNNVRIYSCIYCLFTVQNKNDIRIHVANKHPDKQPYIYDHNTQCNSINEDMVRVKDVFCVSETVVYEEIKLSKEKEDNLQDVMDIKPDFNQLLQMNEETVRVRLRKLTAHTGVQPDKIYRCPHTTCGGFFSIFDLWLRHMKVRHQCLECQCPHCPSPKLLTVEQFSSHFEEHRRHTFICYYCPSTWPNKTLALEHAAKEHGDLGPMRLEQIRFNLTYSYTIIIQNDALKEHENFIAEFLLILDNRLKDFESTENKKLKHQWQVPENTLWVDDYLRTLYNRKVVRTCLMKGCEFRTVSEANLFAHLRSTHVIAGTTFNCSKCKFSLPVCTSFDEVINHIKLHNEFICICAACSLSTSSRQKMSIHIRQQHSARDVPVIQLFKTNQQLFIKLFIVFADNHLTFSTMKNCFCCPEKNMEGDVFSLHLKRYHKFSLNYYCEKCHDFQFKSLKDVKLHFKILHSSVALKIRCELASANDLSVKSLNNFQVEITMKIQRTFALHIKDEPLDVPNTKDEDDVILLEDNDVVIQDSLRELQQPKQVPKLKCTSFSKLIKPSISSSPNFAIISQPAYQQLSTPNSISTERSTIQHFHPLNEGFHQNPNSTTVPNTQFIPNNIINVSTNSFNNVNPSNIFINHNNAMRNQFNSLPTIREIYIPQTTNNPYMGHTRIVQVPANVINQNYGPIPSLNGQSNVYHNS